VTLAYFWGEDSFRLEEAARDLAARLAEATGQSIDTWRTSGEGSDTPARLLDQIEQRCATATLFGAGTLVVVRQPAALVKETGHRERLIKLLGNVATGNALAFLDLVASGAKKAAGDGVVRDAVAERGGTVAQFPALARERMEGWLNQRAQALGVAMGPGAARLLAERVGAHVHEGDVDRRRQTELAATELDKLALFRPGATISQQDVATLVDEAMPGSAWALLDALGSRRTGDAAKLTERLLGEGLPLQVLVSQFHRRLRDLIAIGEHLASGSRPADIVREMRLAPYRAQKLAEQARGWRLPELEQAMAGLAELDLLSKGIGPDGSQRSVADDRSRLALFAWLGALVARQA
jgi:DNA polymerase-3 subunit delta